MKDFLKQLFTEDDNTTFCIAKVMAITAFVSFLGYAGYGVYVSKAGDLTNFASGLMQVLIGSGTIIAGKQLTSNK